MIWLWKILAARAAGVQRDKIIFSRLERGVYLISGVGHSQAWSVGGFFIMLTSEMVKECTPAEVCAVVSHERGHVRLLHSWVRRVRNVMCSAKLIEPGWQKRILHKQEYAADMYAAKRGHATGLMSFFAKNSEQESYSHPATWDRIERLKSFLGEKQ